MCTEMYKKMQTKRIYSEVVMRLRTSKVATDVIGSEFLKYAILAYLHNPKLSIHELAVESIGNASSGIHGISKEEPEEAIALMRDALETVNQKMDEDNTKAVEKFIKTITEEVRIAEMVYMRVISYEINANSEQTEVFIQTAIRRMRKPDEKFKEVLNWIAGKFGYESLTELMADLNAIAMCRINYKKTAKKLVELFPNENFDSDDVFELLTEVKSKNFSEDHKKKIKGIEDHIMKEILYAVDALIDGKDNLMF